MADLTRREPVSHAVELAVSSSWFARSWRFAVDVTQAFFPVASDVGDGCEVCGVASIEARLQVDCLSFESTVAWAWREQDTWMLDSLLEVRTETGLDVGLGHRHRPDDLWWSGRPGAVRPVEVWRVPVDPLWAGVSSDVTRLSLARTGPGLHGRVWAGLVWSEALDAELGLASGYTAACGCWRVGVTGQRHASAPRWDVLTVVELLPSTSW